MAGPNIARPVLRVLVSRGKIVGLLIFTCLKEPYKERATPTTTCPRSVALAELTCSANSIDFEKVNDLSLGHVKAKAEFVVEFHDFPQGV